MTAMKEHSLQYSSPSVKTILVVEDDTSIGEFLQKAIEQETSHVVLLVTTSQHAQETVHHIKPDLLILDYRLTDSTGIALYDQLRTFDGLESVPALILSASLEKYRHEIEHRQLIGLAKPIDLDDLLQTIETLLQRA